MPSPPGREADGLPLPLPLPSVALSFRSRGMLVLTFLSWTYWLSSQDIMSSVLVENGCTAADLWHNGGGGGGDSGTDGGAAAASGGPSLPCWPAADSGGELNGSTGGGGGGLWAASSRGPAGGGSRQRGREWFRGTVAVRRRTGASAAEKKVCGWEMPVGGESGNPARGEGGGGGVRRAWSCRKGAPLASAAEQDAAEGARAEPGGASMPAAVAQANGAAKGDKTEPKPHENTAETKPVAGAAPAAGSASTGEDKEDGCRASTGIRPLRRGGSSGAVVTPPRPKPAEAPTTVSPVVCNCPPRASKSAVNGPTTKLADKDAAYLEGGASSVSPQTAVAEKRDGHAAAAVAGGAEIVGSSCNPRAAEKDGSSGVRPAASTTQKRLANGSPKMAAADGVAAATAAEPKGASERPPLNGDGSSKGADWSASTAGSGAAMKVRAEPAMVRSVPKPVATPGASPAVRVVGAPGASPANGVLAAPGALPAVGVVKAPGALPAVGIVKAPGPMPAVGVVNPPGPMPAVGVMNPPGPMPAVGVANPPGPMPAVGAVHPPGPMPAVGVVHPPGPMPAVGVVNPPGPMPAVGIVDAPGPGHRYHGSGVTGSGSYRGPLQTAWQQPLPRYPALTPGGAYRLGGGAFGRSRNGPVVDEVALRLAAVSEALTMLEDVAILPRLYRVAESVQVEVDRRDEVHAQNVTANRIERVSGVSLQCNYCSRHEQAGVVVDFWRGSAGVTVILTPRTLPPRQLHT